MIAFGLHRNNNDILGLWCSLLKKNLEGSYSSAAVLSMAKECYVEVLIQGKFLQQPWGGLVEQWLQGRNSHLHLSPAVRHTCSFPQPCLSVSPRFGLGIHVSTAYLLFAVACSPYILLPHRQYYLTLHPLQPPVSGRSLRNEIKKTTYPRLKNSRVLKIESLQLFCFSWLPLDESKIQNSVARAMFLGYFCVCLFLHWKMIILLIIFLCRVCKTSLCSIPEISLMHTSFFSWYTGLDSYGHIWKEWN